MNKTKTVIIIAAIILIVIVGFVLIRNGNQDSQDDELSRLKRESEALRIASENLQEKINQVEAAYGAYEYYSSQLP